VGYLGEIAKGEGLEAGHRLELSPKGGNIEGIYGSKCDWGEGGRIRG